MDTNNTQQTDKILDMYNEVQEILQQEYLANKIDAKTVGHIKASLMGILNRIPTDKYETLRKELYDLLQIINM